MRNFAIWTRAAAPGLKVFYCITIAWMPGWNGGGSCNPYASTNIEDYCPIGDVDGIDGHLYDEGHSNDNVARWNNMLNAHWGLKYLADLCDANGKRFASSEWGLTWHKPQGGPIGGDNPYFVEQFYNFMVARNALYAVYFDVNFTDGYHGLNEGRTPNSEVKMRQLWAV